jgi:hypothetical protein
MRSSRSRRVFAPWTGLIDGRVWQLNVWGERPPRRQVAARSDLAGPSPGGSQPSALRAECAGGLT